MPISSTYQLSQKPCTTICLFSGFVLYLILVCSKIKFCCCFIYFYLCSLILCSPLSSQVVVAGDASCVAGRQPSALRWGGQVAATHLQRVVPLASPSTCTKTHNRTNYKVECIYIFTPWHVAIFLLSFLYLGIIERVLSNRFNCYVNRQCH